MSIEKDIGLNVLTQIEGLYCRLRIEQYNLKNGSRKERKHAKRELETIHSKLNSLTAEYNKLMSQ